MKKSLLLLPLLSPLIVLASDPKVISLETTVQDNKITYNGVMENGSYAVMCKLYDSSDKELDLLSSEVDNTKFTGEFEVTKGEYTIKCANYDGGSIKSVSVKVEDEIKTYTVRFDTQGGNTIEDVTVKENEKVKVPTIPTKDKNSFIGWYEDKDYTKEYDFNTPVQSNITLYAKWVSALEEKTYTYSDDKGNSITFQNEEGHTFNFSIIDIMPMTDEELAKMNATREEYNTVKKKVEEETKTYGTLLAFYQIEVSENDKEIHTGSFNVKLKMTEEMKKYETFKLVYIDDDFKATETIDLKVDGEYLVGTLPHLSNYALLGTKKEVKSNNPQTFDNIFLWVGILTVSIIGSVITISLIKRNNKAIK